MVSLDQVQSGTASTGCLYGKAAVLQSLPSVSSHCHDMRHGVCKHGVPCPGVAHPYGTRRGSRSGWGTGSLVNKYRETAAESLLNKHVRVGRSNSCHHSFPTPSTSSAAPPPKPISGLFPQSQRQHSQMLCMKHDLYAPDASSVSSLYFTGNSLSHWLHMPGTTGGCAACCVAEHCVAVRLSFTKCW